MSRHLKNIVISGMKAKCATFVTLPPNSTPHTKGVRYFLLAAGFTSISGAMDPVKIGRQRRKRIVVRPSRFRIGLHELYTYHFPTHWSAACVANRELIKLAQRQAHALEHDHSPEAYEWKLRFLIHYFRVFKGGEQPEPGLKPYSRFYQYTYVCIYRHLQQIAQRAQEKTALREESPSLGASHDNAASSPSDISFDPIPLRRLQTFARRRQAFSRVFLGSMTPLLV